MKPVRIVSIVTQGRHPVLGAKVKLVNRQMIMSRDTVSDFFGYRAYVKDPTGNMTAIDLYDNGVFGDTTRNDGIYSRYFVTATSVGRYSVECEASGDDSTFINEGFSASAIVVKDSGNKGQLDFSPW